MICSAQSVWERSFHSIKPIVTSIIVTDKHADRALSLFQIPWLEETTLHCLVFCLSRRRGVSRLIVSCFNVTTTRITVSNEHQAVSENSVGGKTEMQFTWNINTYIQPSLFLSLSRIHRGTYKAKKPYRLEDNCKGNVLNREKPERSGKEKWKSKRETKGLNMDVL